MKVKIIKLSTGEELVSRCVEKEDEVILNKPMTLQAVQTNQANQVGMALMPWLMAGKCEEVVIKKSLIIAVDEPKDQAEKKYLSNVTGLSL